MNLSLDNNVNKFVLLVVCGVIVLLVVNMNKKKLGNQVCTLISILVIVLSGFFGYTLLNQENEMFYINTSSGNSWRENNASLDGRSFDLDTPEYEDTEDDLPTDYPMPTGNPMPTDYPMPTGNPQTVEDTKTPDYPMPTGNPMPPDYPMPTGNPQTEEDISTKYAIEIAEAQAMMSSSDKDSLETFQNSSVATSAVASSANSSATLNAKELLPSDNSLFNNINPQINDSKINDQNLLIAGHHIGVNTVGCSLRNANRGLRSDPPCPTTPVSPWMQTTICPDLLRKSLDPVPSPTLSFSP